MPSPGYGWVWRPGYRFAPAWVYWYWGPSYVAWVPVGYYSSYYGHYGRGFRFGIHGWSGGSWSYFADWTFCSTHSYRRRDLRRHVHRGSHLARNTRSFALERGLISTDSRLESRQRAARRGVAEGPRGDSLPDVTAFVARQRELPAEVSERVFSGRRGVARTDLWEAPTGPRTDSPRARAAVPRLQERGTIDTWRRESGRLRSGVAPPRPVAGPRARGVAPRERSHTPALDNRAERSSPRPSPPAAGRSPVAQSRPGGARAPTASRPPVVRRVWEGIRARQRSQPSTVRPPADSQGRRQPSSVERRPQAPRRPPSAQGRSQPRQRPPSARSSPPPRRESSTSRGSRGPSRRSSARPSGRSGERSSRERETRRPSG
jgi:hypothetical protein